jgi:hypothetical protein
MVRADVLGWCFFLLKKGMLRRERGRGSGRRKEDTEMMSARGKDGTMINTRRSDNYIRRDSEVLVKGYKYSGDVRLKVIPFYEYASLAKL